MPPMWSRKLVGLSQVPEMRESFDWSKGKMRYLFYFSAVAMVAGCGLAQLNPLFWIMGGGGAALLTAIAIFSPRSAGLS